MANTDYEPGDDVAIDDAPSGPQSQGVETVYTISDDKTRMADDPDIAVVDIIRVDEETKDEGNSEVPGVTCTEVRNHK